MARLRLLLVSDMHGSGLVFRKLANAPGYYKVDAVVYAGDLSGKSLITVVSLGNGRFRIPFIDENKVFSKAEADEKIRELRNQGNHVKVVSEEEYADLVNNKEKLNAIFDEVIRNDIVGYLRYVDEKYAKMGIKLYLIPGNDDPQSLVNSIRNNPWSSLVFFDESIVNVGDYLMLGFGYSNPTPWNTPRELSEDEIYRRLTGMFNSLGNDSRRTIAVIHTPPHGTVIDQAPMLTKDLKVVRVGGEVLLTHVGSLAVRRIIEEYGPLMGLHGHVHESSGVDYLKANGVKVPVFNAGSEYQYGVLRGILIIMDGDRVNYLPVRG